MQQTMQAQQLRRMAERSAVAFLLAVLCVYPLYIDKFSNLGVVKFTGVATLSWAFCLWLGRWPPSGRIPVRVACPGAPTMAFGRWGLWWPRAWSLPLPRCRPPCPCGGWAATTAAA